MTRTEPTRLNPGHQQHHRVVVIGGGNGGLSVAGRLERMGVEDIVVVEPRSEHLYKPLFSHIAGGTAPGSMAVREQGAVMPKMWRGCRMPSPRSIRKRTPCCSNPAADSPTSTSS